MIRAIITDVDGVIVGHTKNVNFPLPHTDVLAALHNIRQKGIPIILCTAKSMNAIKPIIEKSYLNNPHISDGGALIYDPVDNVTVASHLLEKPIIKKIIEFTFSHNIYIEIHTKEKYIIEKRNAGVLSAGHSEIMLEDPEVVENISMSVDISDIMKLVIVCETPEKVQIAKRFFETVGKEITVVWTHHPTMLPSEFAIVTAPGVSKGHAAEEVLKSLRISFEETLGIGDTPGDWKFMERCGYVAVIGDKFLEFIAQAETKGEGKYIVAPSVEENGILHVLKQFSLT